MHPMRRLMTLCEGVADTFIDLLSQHLTYDDDGKLVSESPVGKVAVTHLRGRTFELNSVEAVERGGGRHVMQIVTAVADKARVTLVTYASPIDTPHRGAGSMEDLERFYQAFGFREKSWSSEPVYGVGIEMMRKPGGG